MRLLHTADWHLGHTLHDISRQHEHAHFLTWLLGTLERERVDVLVIAGDIFETSNPRAEALAAWYDFIAELRTRRFRDLEVVVIGGNHDSARRLNAPGSLYRRFGFHVLGGVPYTADGEVDIDAMLIPLRDPQGRVAAWCCAVPYLRARDLPAISEAGVDGPVVAGVRALYERVFGAARGKRRPTQALIGVGHLMMASSALSPDSERKIQAGNRHAVPVDVFPRDASYVALGHLHRAQAVGGLEHIRYAGSPIPLSMNEAAYPHQVVLVDLDGADVAHVRAVRVPRLVDMIRIPEAGEAALPQVLQELGSLPRLVVGEEQPAELRPFVAVHVSIAQPEPTLRDQIEEAAEGRAVRLITINVSYTGQPLALADAKPTQLLDELTLGEVFVARYKRDYDGVPSDELLDAFHELVECVQRGGAVVPT